MGVTMVSNLRVALIGLVVGVGCGGAQGTSPHDMSAAEHEAAAREEESSSATHAGQYDPTASEAPAPCSPKSVCWTARRNPTQRHRDDAEAHRDLAARHREAARSLRDAEARACVGIDDEDRDLSPFYFREDIAAVDTLRETESERTGKSSLVRTVGARVVFRAVPGLTAEWLQRSIECHAARAAVVGHEDPTMSYCPAAVKGVRVSVASTGSGFAVELRGTSPASIDEIVRRANALVPAP
jgi:hypothetical protein